jgi:hypothetical protein
MLPGLNHNFKYRDQVFHIQTEDTGKISYTVVTHLYLKGTIIATKKTYYGDAKASPDLKDIVKDLIDTQHKKMLLDLKNGLFDDKIRELCNGQI